MAKNSAFTLTEILIVVAIIGVLMTIALPQYQRFVARSEQSIAKTELAQAFGVQASFRSQYRYYTREWPSIGFIPEGVVLASGSYPTVSSRSRVYALIAGTNPTGNASLHSSRLAKANYQFNYSYPSHNIACALVSPSAGMGAGLTVDAAIGSPAAFVERERFIHSAIGCPGRDRATNAELDRWTINEKRELLNTQSGI